MKTRQTPWLRFFVEGVSADPLFVYEDDAPAEGAWDGDQITVQPSDNESTFVFRR